MTPRFHWHRLFMLAASVALFLPLYLFLSLQDLFIVLDSMSICIGGGLLIAYSPGIWKWLWAPRTTSGYILVIGIIATWIAAVGRLAWLSAWRLMGQPAGFMDRAEVAFFIWLFIVGGSAHLIANSAIEVESPEGKREEVPVFGWAILSVVVAIGFVLGLGMVWWL